MDYALTIAGLAGFISGWTAHVLLSGRFVKHLKYIIEQHQHIMATQAEVAAALVALKDQVTKVGTEVSGKLDELAAAIAAQGNASPEVEAALADLTTAVQAVDDLVADPVVEPPPVEPPVEEPPATP